MTIGIGIHRTKKTVDPHRPIENMNGDYKISNPNPLAGVVFDSDYSKFSDVEYFDVSSDTIHPIITLILIIATRVLCSG